MTHDTSQLGARLRRPARIRSLTLGDTRLTYVPDGSGTLLGKLWIPQPTDQFWAEHSEYLDEGGHLVTGNGGLLVEQGERAILIDAGVGPLRMGPPENPFGVLSGGELLNSLATIGRRPADIEAVAFTHLHIDHVGWAWHPAPDSELPAFTNAAYLVTAPEWTERHVAEAQGMGSMIAAIEQQVRVVDDGEEIFPGVRVMLLPGHSPGHSAYVISAGGQRVIAFGDAFHSPIQISHPLWRVPADHDADLAVSVRHRLVHELADSNTLGFGIHFADVPFGRVRIDDDKVTWEPVEG